MFVTDSRAEQLSGRLAADMKSVLRHVILITGCYLIAILATQVSLFKDKGVWFGDICSIYRQI